MRPRSVAEASAAVLQEMNPLVAVLAAPGSAAAVPEASWLAQYQVRDRIGPHAC